VDDYLFIALAKLKADFRGVTRPRNEEPVQQPRATEVSPARSPRVRRSATLSPDLLSVVSTHGLRGWS
jgi:hypothetical protein